MAKHKYFSNFPSNYLYTFKTRCAIADHRAAVGMHLIFKKSVACVHVSVCACMYSMYIRLSFCAHMSKPLKQKQPVYNK